MIFIGKINLSIYKDDYMKRIISLLLIAATLFLFAACSVKSDAPEFTTVLPPEIEKVVQSKEFKDSSGKTVIKINVELPQITEFANEKVKNYINGKAMNLFNDACNFAERNIESASSFMESMKSDKPWSKKITIEETLINDRYACFLVYDSLSYYDSEVEPAVSTICFDVRSGAECTLADFSTYSDDPALGFEGFLYDILVPALPKKFHNPSFLNDEVYSKISEIASADNFYLTSDGIGFYFNKKDVNEALDGTFKIKFNWNELSAYYYIPEIEY